jgi:DnaK suppressor protein
MTSFPSKLIEPIKNFLEKRLVELKRNEKKIKKSDPFTDESRTANNSLEEDVDEQVGHFDAEVKATFIKKQIVEFRKALTKIKLGKYGLCDRCGAMIDTDRLAIKPEADLCLKCEKDKEA